ncbi:MAG: L-carnitine dehydratase/bile acid-inducible protein [Sphaerisporangium sp.]|nr:L-carnitine dehydratase/bile acid-inducible protein [Sphaerisporangium sp.]
MIGKIIEELGAEVGLELPVVHVTGDDPVLPSVFKVGTAAAASVGAVAAAVALLHWKRSAEADFDTMGHYRRPQPGPSEMDPGGVHAVVGDGGPVVSEPRVDDEVAMGVSGVGPRVTVDVRHAAVAFRDERYFQINGKVPISWAPLSGDYPTADGWVRLHCNFDHHRDAALTGLELPSGADRVAVATACAGRTALDVEQAVTNAGGCAAAMRSPAEWQTHSQGRAVAKLPLIGFSRLDDAGPRTAGRGASGRPLAGVRVLDLTRVIAGPVATRTLAAHGAEVLRVGAAHLPEVPGLVISTAFGKRSCELDLRTQEGAAAFRELVAAADAVVQSYRPGALAALGFGPEELAAIRPGIVCVDISAYGSRGPWAGRRGFDSLVQMACGIAHEGGDGTRPVPLPAQVLDHATGRLAALAVIAGLLRREAEGGSWHAEVALARTAVWLDGLGRVDGAGLPEPEVDDLLDEMGSSLGNLTYVRAPGEIGDARPYWSSPPPRRGEHPPMWG